jgi:Mn2+/Fe2+ NRAMP family transporter
MNKLKNFFQILGPGLLYAGAAIGVSHLVQSTRAGAGFGFSLLWVIIIANILKYPFFEFGPRYTAATGKNLIKGYASIGKWAIVMFFLQTVGSMFAIQAALVVVTSGILINVLGLNISPFLMSAFILGSSMIILILGKFRLLNGLIKYIIIALAASTLVAVIYAAGSFSGFQDGETVSFNLNNYAHLAFLIALFGWMPAPFDVSVWQSIWAEARQKDSGKITSLKDSLLDFNVGYIGTAMMAIMFMLLGAFVMHGGSEKLSSNGIVFSEQLIRIYTSTLGMWSYPIISIAVLFTMISTTLTVFDAYTRVLTPTTEIMLGLSNPSEKREKLITYSWMLILLIGTLLLLSVLKSSMTNMVDFATILSFLIAPLLAILNYKLITQKDLPDYAKPKPILKVIAIIGLITITAFSIYYLYFLIFERAII